MRTEKEIRERIRDIEREHKKEKVRVIPKHFLNFIEGLKWVLDENE